MDEQGDFGARLRRLRRARDMTQAQLAAAVGCAAVTVQKIETGALRPSRQVAERLADTLGVPPGERAAFVALARGAALPAPPAAATLGEPAAGQLPIPATALVGRATLLAAVRAAFDDGARLLTLVGPPGIGKTRLALAAAWELRGRFSAGARFVPLAAVSAPARVADAAAEALGLEPVAGRSASEALRTYVQRRELLLVLDNFEQVVEAAPLVAELLAAAPGLRALVTSRAALRISGERELPVPPLDGPKAEGGGQKAEAILVYPSVALFVARAQAVRPDLALSEASLRDIGAICARLDGLPLAIELAAARARMFPPAALLERLDRRLALLSGGPRDVPARQQTLRAAIDWSYRLLGPEAQGLFARLGVFVGGFTLAAASALTPQTPLPAGVGERGSAGVRERQGERANDASALEVLEALVDHSLVQSGEGVGGAARFTLLETLREYALERLEAAGELHAAGRRHAEHFCALAEAGSLQVWGGAQVAWLDALSVEHDNLRAALAWALGPGGDAALAVRMVGALGWFWHFRGHWPEGRRWLARALAVCSQGSAPAAALARAHYAAGGLAWAERDYGAAQDHAERAVALARGGGDAHVLGHALGVRGLVALYRGGDPEADFAASLAAFERAADSAGAALALLRLGLAAWARGELAQAETRLERALAQFEAVGAAWGAATAHASLGDVARARGAWRQVAQRYGEALGGYRRLRSTWYVANSLAALGGALGMLGEDERAAQMEGASAALLESIGMEIHELDRAQHAAGLEAARARLGAERYAAAQARGRAMPLDELVAAPD